jgi:3-hydroxyisobutyrate dehydrogenase
MGSRTASNLLRAGHIVTIWNRKPEATAALVAIGTIQATTPKEAVLSADFVIAMLRDDLASEAVWFRTTVPCPG